MAIGNDSRLHRLSAILLGLAILLTFGVAHATVYRLPAVADAHISSAYPGTNDGYSIYLWAGYDPTNDTLRALMKFNVSSIPALEADYITSASLKVYVSGSSARTFCLRTNSSDWNEGTVTWNNQPSVSWAPRVGITFPNSGTYQEITFNLNFLKNWIKGVEPNYGLQVRSETENLQGAVDLRSRHSSWPETLIVVTNPPVSRRLTIGSINPNSGVPITVSPSDIYGNANGTTTFDRYYTDGTVVYLTAPAKVGANNFKEWRRDGVYYPGGQNVDLLMGSDHSMTAVYETPIQYTLSVNSCPEDGIPIWVDGVATYTPFTKQVTSGTNVQLSAPNPALGRAFLAWWKDCQVYSIQQTVNLTVNANVAMTAEYTKNVPSGVTATGECDRIRVNWSTVSGASGYCVYKDGSQSPIACPSAPPYIDYVSDNSQHCYQITATYSCCGNPSDRSSSQCATAKHLLSQPSPSVGPNPVCTDVQYCVTWNALSGATGYDVQEDGGGWTDVGNVTSKCYSKSSPGSHSYAVRGKNECGPGYPSNLVTETVKGVPGQTNTPGASPNPVCINVQYCISWNAVAGATGYDIQENGGPWTDVGNAISKCYIKSSAGNYSYTIRARNDCGPGNPSASVTVVVQSCYSISGKVFRALDGSVVPDYPVDLYAAGVKKNSALTGNDGIYEITNIPSGLYDIKTGATTVSPNIVINRDSAGLNIMLAPPNNDPRDVNEIQNESVARDFSLNQNRPNPFNPTTEIAFSLPRGAEVTLAIYNITGQRIATLIDHHLEAGSHSIIWNGRDETGRTVSSGIYFYRLKAGEFTETRKMVLLK
jgi:hypothetical protein